jgi:hypothetical protein
VRFVTEEEKRGVVEISLYLAMDAMALAKREGEGKA